MLFVVLKNKSANVVLFLNFVKLFVNGFYWVDRVVKIVDVVVVIKG